jgi:hypothetical protein
MKRGKCSPSEEFPKGSRELASYKDRHDPANVFSLNQNIRPSA